MNTLIAYYSFTGNNETMAVELKQRLGCDLIKIETKKSRSKFSIFVDLMFKRLPAIADPGISLTNYERFIFIAPIWAGKIASPMRSFLHTYKHNIHDYSFLSVCGGGQSSQKERVKSELTQLLNGPPEHIAELWINNILPAVKKNTLAVSDFRLKKEDVELFQEELDDFVRLIRTQSPSLSKA